MKGEVGVRWGSWQYLQDRFNLGVTIISFPGIGSLFSSQLAERCGSLVVLDNIARGDDISEPVALGDFSALLSFSTDD